MKGDFSNLYFDPNDNFNGVIEQQGRVRLDRDGLAQTQITTHWQDTGGQDMIGSGVAAIPADDVNAFKVTRARVDSDQVILTLLPGRAWVDGRLVYLSGGALPVSRAQALSRQALYLQPPIQTSAATPDTIGDDIRDAVILEVWRDTINGFQQPDRLIEPALGGPDTTERLHTSMALKLYRLKKGENCRNIRNKLKDTFANKGKLTVSLQPTEVIEADCPVVAKGGYTGFEHLLYRIEIAQVDSGVPMFKWSQFNGGLVGRGWFEDTAVGTQRVNITANLQAISTAGLDSFYLEVVEHDPDAPPARGHWQVTYGARATLNNDNQLEITEPLFGTVPDTDSENSAFFRLWNGIREMSEFLAPAAADDPNTEVREDQPTELIDGIRLVFEPATASNYAPSDYWTFQVRAGDIDNPDVDDDGILIKNQPPEGIHYHRVPLAILNWTAQRGISFENGEIEDCRDVFNPLTRQRVCCTYTVGDGRSTHGDFDALEEALRHLPAWGGQICLLPGLHEANVELTGKRNIIIKGCEKRTLVVPRASQRDQPIFQITDCRDIVLEHLDMITLGGTAIALQGTQYNQLKDIEIRDNRFIACEQAIRVNRGDGIKIVRNVMRMLDKVGAGVAIYLLADDSLIEHNDIGVIPAPNMPPIDQPDPEEPLDPTDPCARLELVYTNIPLFTAYVAQIWKILLLFLPKNPFNAMGGIQLAGGCERVVVLHNQINGGAGNGIALGTSIEAFLADLDLDIDEPLPTLEHQGKLLRGDVSFQGKPMPNINLQFEHSDGKSYTDTTGKAGEFQIRGAPAGTYSVLVLSPGYRIASITPEEARSGLLYHIELAQVDLDLSDLLAFLYDIHLGHNKISNMGLSGIGLPAVMIPAELVNNQRGVAQLLRFYAQALRLFGNPILRLDIDENHIFECFQNPLTQALRNLIGLRGLGGITLGLCTDASIHRNRIEKNGISYTKPICGIWITYGEEIDITHNYIVDNAPFPASATATLEPGQRGGIVMIASALSILNFLQGDNRSPAALITRRPAVRIQDNIVDQPAGLGLGLFAFGPVTVLNNQFNCELSGLNPLERYVGSVLLLNLGGLNQAGGFIRSDSIDFTDDAAATIRQPDFQRDSVFRLPNGNTLFNSNQIRQGLDNQSLMSQLIWTADDLGYDGNQSEAMAVGFPLGGFSGLLNTMLLGATLRVSDNRLKEPLRSPAVSAQFSLLTLSTLMNITTMNQGTHCLFAADLPPGQRLIFKGNQVLDPRFCPGINLLQDFVEEDEA